MRKSLSVLNSLSARVLGSIHSPITRSRRANFRRYLRVESLEERRLLAFAMFATQSKIYEGGSSFDPVTSFPSESLYAFTDVPYGSDELRNFSLKVTIDGPVDSYFVSGGVTSTIINSNQRELVFGPGDYSNYFAFGIVVTQDEEVPTIPNSSELVDPSDFTDDNLTITARLSYAYVVSPGPPEQLNNLGPYTQTKNLLIEDNDLKRNLVLSTADGTALEPHAVFYAPELPTDYGVFQISVPSEWRGGSVVLQVGGSAVLGTDYTLSINPSVPGANTTGISANVFSLYIPSRESGGGAANLLLRLTPLGDSNETEGVENATLAFAPPDQLIISSVFTPDPATYYGGLSTNYRFTTTGSGSVSISDEQESIVLSSSPSSVKEYAVSPDYAYLDVLPSKSGVNLLFATNAAAYLEFTVGAINQASKRNVAIPGIDYSIAFESGSPLTINLIDATTGLYRSSLFSGANVPRIRLVVTPNNDRILEDDETIDAKLFSVVGSDPPKAAGSATITIEEMYVREKQDEDKRSEVGCSCPCACEGGVDVKSQGSEGNVSASSEQFPVTVYSMGVHGTSSIMLVGIPLYADKAVPLSIDVQIDGMRSDLASSNGGSGIGAASIGNITSFNIDTSFGYNAGDIVWYPLYINLGQFSGTSSTASNGNAAGDRVIPIRVLAHPNFNSTPATPQRFSGWLGYHNAVVVNQATGDLSNNTSSGSINDSLPLTSLPINKINPFGPGGVNLFGLKRAIVGANFLVSKDTTPLPFISQTINGVVVQRVGNAVRYRGAVQAKLGNAVIEPDGTSATFIDDVLSPVSLSTFSGNTLTDRYGFRYVFGANGRTTAEIDASGNQTDYFYHLDGWVNRRVDALGNELRLEKTGEQTNPALGAMWTTYRGIMVTDRLNPTSLLNRSVDIRWDQTSSSVYGNAGTLTIVGVDPDASGPRKALQEKFIFSGGSLNRIERGEFGVAPIQWVQIGFAATPGAVGLPGRLVSTLTRQDGAIQSFESPIFLTQAYAASSGTTLYSTTTTVGGSTGRQVGTNIVYVTQDATKSPFQIGLASDTDWNGNRTVYKVDDRGRLVQRWDPIHVESVIRDLLPVNATIGQITGFIRNMSLTDPVIAARFNGTQYDSLSYRYGLAAANRDTWGNVTSGKDLGEVTNATLPDADDFLRRDFPIAQRINGALQPQQTGITYTADKNVATVSRPTLFTQSSEYNQSLDIVTKSIDEVGTLMNQTVDSNGLIIKKTYSTVASNSPGYNASSPLDVNDDGSITTADNAIINNYFASNPSSNVAPPGAPFMDTNGDGFVSAIDQLLIINYANLPEPKSPPSGYTPVSQVDVAYATTLGLPKGLVSEVTETTGRTNATNRTAYQYFNNANLAYHGQVLSITEAAGTAAAATTTYAYTSRGLVDSITDPVGRVTRYVYDLLDRVVAIIGPDPDATGPLLSPTIRMDYDVFGNVIAIETINSFIDPSIANSSQLLVTALVDGYQYDSQERLTRSAEQRGITTWYLFTDALGTIQRTQTKATAIAGIAVTNAALTTYATANSIVLNSPIAGTPNSNGITLKYPGLQTTYTYDFNGNTTSVLANDALVGASSNRLTTIAYDRLDRPITITKPLPTAGLITTANDNRASVNDGFQTQLTYDNLGNVIKIVDDLNNLTTYAYDILNRLTHTQSPDGTIYQYSYSPNASGWTVSVTDPEGRVVNVISDYLGRTIERSGATSKYTASYWPDGQLRTTTDELGRITSYDYDPAGRLKTIMQPAAIANDSATAPITSYSYTVDGLLSSMTDPAGRVTTMQYDAGGRKSKQIAPDPDGPGALLPSYAVWQYDSLGNVTLQAYALTDPINTFTPGNQPERFNRDARFRVTNKFNERGWQEALNIYDSFGNVTATIDASTNRTNFTYNQLNQLVTNTQVVSSVTPNVNLTQSYSYDGAGNLRSVMDRNGRTIEYGYDSEYQVTRETWKTGATINRTIDYAYDLVGNLRSIDDSDNVWGTDFQFAYDTRDQLQLERQSIPGLSTSVVFDRNYDSVGNRTRLAANFGGTIAAVSNLGPSAASTITGGVNDFQTAFGYDRLDRLVGLTQTSQTIGNAVAPKFVSTSYNTASQITDMRRYSDASAVAGNLEVHSRFAYDSAGRLTGLTHAKTEIAAGQVWNGTSTLPASVTASNMLGAYNLGYDRDNRVNQFRSYQDSLLTTYSYYSTDEIFSSSHSAIAGLATPALIPPTVQTPTDGTGNRTNPSVQGNNTAPLGNHNRVTNDGTNNYLYDNQGNTIQKTVTATGRVTLYSWDHRNRLTQVQEKVSGTGAVLDTVQYSYDAFDRRTIKRLDNDGNGTFEKFWAFVSDGSHEVLELEDSDGQAAVQPFRVSNRFLHGNAVDMVLADEQYASSSGPALNATAASTTAGTTLWTLGDHLGSIRDVVDNNGIIRQHLLFDSFGNRLREVDRDATGAVIASTSPAAIDTLFGYTGRDWDADTGLQYNRARWYDPVLGKWLSQDPIGFAAGDTNLYRYVGNKVTTHIDPSGLEDIFSWLFGGSKNQSAKVDEEYDQSIYDSSDSALAIAEEAARRSFDNQSYTKDLVFKLLQEAERRRRCEGDGGLAANYWVWERFSEAGRRISGTRNTGSDARSGIGAGSHLGTAVAGTVVGVIVGQNKLPAGSLTPREVEEIQRVADLYETIIDVVGSRAAGEGRNIDTNYPKGKGDKTRSDIDFRIDSNHQCIDQISNDLKNVGGGVGSADKKYSTRERPTHPPYIRFIPRKK